MKVVGVVLLVIFLAIPIFLFSGFIWMVCLGALSHIFNQPSWAISYWHSVIVAFIFWLLFGGLANGKD